MKWMSAGYSRLLVRSNPWPLVPSRIVNLRRYFFKDVCPAADGLRNRSDLKRRCKANSETILDSDMEQTGAQEHLRSEAIFL
jgi:hypothetical protein